ncbi:MAG: 4-(cytidine 5'-diphospho)-2-C-methyl-D-erythritol kinase [Fimbriimonadales bacterium]
MQLLGIAPAKINLTLEILNRRADGYHNLASVFHTLSLSDTLSLEPLPHQSGTIQIESEGWAVPNSPQNSIWQALQRFGEAINAAQWVGWQVKLQKRIPTQAGLGGGSSDAGTTLKLLAQWATAQGIPVPDLAELALQIGSDVPFFVLGVPCARAEGRGERLMVLPSLPRLAWVLAKPPELGVPTGWAYARLQRTESSPTESHHTDRLMNALQSGAVRDAETLAPYLHNDFEAVLIPEIPALGAVRATMEESGVLRVLLCGSGAVQAGLCRTEHDAHRLAERLRQQGYWAEVCFS